MYLLEALSVTVTDACFLLRQAEHMRSIGAAATAAALVEEARDVGGEGLSLLIESMIEDTGQSEAECLTDLATLGGPCASRN